MGAIAYLVVLTVVGTVGYVTVGGWPWQEALYMTVITVTAVGFREVQPMSGLGQDFTMGLLAADSRLDVGDEMIVLGHPDQVTRLRDLAQA